MNAKEVKADMLGHVLYRLRYAAAITEYGGVGSYGIADIFGMQESGFTHEFEVKVSRSDLAGELNAIEYWTRPEQLAIGDPGHRSAPVAKGGKHCAYLKGVLGPLAYAMKIPNKFSFVVPAELREFAKDGLKNSPYGLYVIDGDPSCVKRAEYLHKEKATEQIRMNILRKASGEVASLRRQVLEGMKCTGCYKSLSTRCEVCAMQIKDRRDYKRRSDACWKKVDHLPENERGPAFTACLLEEKGKTI